MTTPTPEAVKRLTWTNHGMVKEFDGKFVEASDYDALLARVDALTKERDAMKQAAKDVGASFRKAMAERDAALAASGAVAAEMREAAAQMCVRRRQGWIAPYIRAITIPTDAAAALERYVEPLIDLIGGAKDILENSGPSGTCCCGDDMENHSDPMSCGHSPVDAADYYKQNWMEEANAILARGAKRKDEK